MFVLSTIKVSADSSSLAHLTDSVDPGYCSSATSYLQHSCRTSYHLRAEQEVREQSAARRRTLHLRFRYFASG